MQMLRERLALERRRDGATQAIGALQHDLARRSETDGNEPLLSLETRKLLLGHKNGDITTHYSAAEIGELIAATNRICAAKGTPSITLLRVANG